MQQKRSASALLFDCRKCPADISQIRNVLGEGLNQTVVYIPIKKGAVPAGKDPYEWDMELKSSVEVSGFKVFYSTADNPTMNELDEWSANHTEDGIYKERLGAKETYSDVTMVKLVSDQILKDTISSARLRFSSKEKTESGTLTNNIYSYVGYKIGSAKRTETESDKAVVHLKDAVISGRLWIDADRDGLMDTNEESLLLEKLQAGEKIVVGLYHNDGTGDGVLQQQQEFTDQSKDLTYSFTKVQIHDGDYLKITLPEKNWGITEQFASGGLPETQSHYSQETLKAYLTPGKTESINGGLVYFGEDELPELTVDPAQVILEPGEENKESVSIRLDGKSPAEYPEIRIQAEPVEVNFAGVELGSDASSADVWLKQSEKAEVRVFYNYYGHIENSSWT